MNGDRFARRVFRAAGWYGLAVTLRAGVVRRGAPALARGGAVAGRPGLAGFVRGGLPAHAGRRYFVVT